MAKLCFLKVGENVARFLHYLLVLFILLCRSGRILRHATFIKNKEQTARACSLLL
jgi:hypothetical protein